jgi:hypothetical protein
VIISDIWRKTKKVFVPHFVPLRGNKHQDYEQIPQFFIIAELSGNLKLCASKIKIRDFQFKKYPKISCSAGILWLTPRCAIDKLSTSLAR